MEKPRFIEILKEYNIPESLADQLWDVGVNEDPSEEGLRFVCGVLVKLCGPLIDVIRDREQESAGGKPSESNPPVSEERFTEILKEYGYPDSIIKALWLARPEGDLTEDVVRANAAGGVDDQRLMEGVPQFVLDVLSKEA